ncbi:MAG: class I SAM-dependent methyltransferase [Deltaproteobacteria bacterium]|nr:class I SAM-dependent methyltransferase [Deltaproteobacteria bacterium]
MKESILPAERPLAQLSALSKVDEWAKRVLISLLKKLNFGEIVLTDGEEQHVFGRRSETCDLHASLTVLHPRFYSQVLFGGSIGAGEAYMAGHWSSDDLTLLLRIVLLNQSVFAGLDRGLSRLKAPLYKAYHFLHKDSRKGSRINIAAHYDLGNDFYALFLDETLTYSCGIFDSPECSLQEASVAKYDRICKKLQLSNKDHVLEIGTGWGGFAIHAASQYGCRVTTTTISRAQHDLALERIRTAGVEDKVHVLFKDYRDLKGRFDKLVSIEMIEAVGHHYLETFFRCCSNLLTERGVMALQAITIADHVFEKHKKEVDFIKRYIFPGSCIPSVTAMGDAVAAATDLRLIHLEDITPHYARTLRTWRERFFENILQVRALGYSETFIRMWEFYLCYCEAGFEERYLGDVQMFFAKPLWRGEPLLPSLS